MGLILLNVVLLARVFGLTERQIVASGIMYSQPPKISFKACKQVLDSKPHVFVLNPSRSRLALPFCGIHGSGSICFLNGPALPPTGSVSLTLVPHSPRCSSFVCFLIWLGLCHSCAIPVNNLFSPTL